MVQRLEHLHGYDSLNCYTSDPENLNDGSGRTDKRDVILHDRLKEAVTALNPGIPESAIDDALKQLCDKRQVMSAIAATPPVSRRGPGRTIQVFRFKGSSGNSSS